MLVFGAELPVLDAPEDVVLGAELPVLPPPLELVFEVPELVLCEWLPALLVLWLPPLLCTYPRIGWLEEYGFE